MTILRLLASGGAPITEDCESNTSSGGAYTQVGNDIVQKVTQPLAGIRFKVMTTGIHTVTLYQGVTVLATKTVNFVATGWGVFTLDAPVTLTAGIGYKIMIAQPYNTAYYNNSGLYDGTNWRCTACYFNSSSYSYTVAMGFVYGGTTYAATGTAIYGPYTLPTVSSFRLSHIDWTVNIPVNTTVTIAAAVVELGAIPHEGDYEPCTKGADMPNIASGKDLYIKVILATTNNTITPTLSDIWFDYEGNDDQSKLRVTLTSAGRFKHPQGNVTVAYAASQGNLKNAAGTLAVPSFSQQFDPAEANLALFFNPNDAENVSVTPAITVLDVNQVTFMDSQNPDEQVNIGSVSVTTVVYDTLNNQV